MSAHQWMATSRELVVDNTGPQDTWEGSHDGDHWFLLHAIDGVPLMRRVAGRYVVLELCEFVRCRPQCEVAA